MIIPYAWLSRFPNVNQGDAYYVAEKMLDAAVALREQKRVASKIKRELWPMWSRWALLLVAISAVLTIVAALNDIY